MSSKLSQIRPWTAELAALERLKNQRFLFFSVSIDQILFKLEDNQEMHNNLDEFDLGKIRHQTTKLPAPECLKIPT